jgi:hypothetical protein
MQYSQSIVVSPLFLAAFSKGSEGKQALIKVQLDTYRNDISSLLSSYHWAEKGSVEKVEIDLDSIMIDEKGNGRFKVKYAINIHYGCSDIDTDLDKSMFITINTDMDSQKAILMGEYIPEREPDDF